MFSISHPRGRERKKCGTRGCFTLTPGRSRARKQRKGEKIATFELQAGKMGIVFKTDPSDVVFPFGERGVGNGGKNINSKRSEAPDYFELEGRKEGYFRR